MEKGCQWLKSSASSTHDVGFLHRGGVQSFPLGLFLKNDPHRADITRLGGTFNHLLEVYPVSNHDEVVCWEEGCMDDEETRVTHLSKQKPCCCSCFDVEFSKTSKYPMRNILKTSRHCSSSPEGSAHVTTECTTGGLNDEMADKPSTSGQSDTEFGYRPVRHMKMMPRDSEACSTILREEELLDALLSLYHIGLAPNFKQVCSMIYSCAT